MPERTPPIERRRGARGLGCEKWPALLRSRCDHGLGACRGYSRITCRQGLQLVQEDRFEAAAKEFERALTLDPRLLRPRYQYAVCLMALARNDEARKEFERLQEAESSGDAGVLYYLGRLDLLADDFPAAIGKLEVIAKNPPYPDTAFYLGVAFIGKRDLQKGVDWLAKAAELAPRDFRVHYRLARAYSALGRDAEARREYDLFTQLREGYNDGARQSLACSDALRTRPIDEARVTCRRLFDPNDPDKLTLLGILFGRNGAYGEAIDPSRKPRGSTRSPSRFTTIWA